MYPYYFAKIRLDTAEKEATKVWYTGLAPHTDTAHHRVVLRRGPGSTGAGETAQTAATGRSEMPFWADFFSFAAESCEMSANIIHL